jgi:hypothetical protein
MKYRSVLIAGALVAGCASEPAEVVSSAPAAARDEHPPLGAEQVRPGEEEDFARHVATIQRIMRSLAERRRSGDDEVRRGFHAKSHACIPGRFEVLADVPAEARYGVFARATTYPAWVRYSNGVGFVQSDRESDVRGLAIKLVGVPGEKLLEAERDALTQDFLMTDNPTPLADDGNGFMEFAEAQADPRSWVFARYLVSHPRAALILSRTFRSVGSLRMETFWSGAAFKNGPSATKYLVKPCQLEPVPRPHGAGADHLREELKRHLATGDICYDFFLQFQVDPETTPVEQATVEWRESVAPPVRVARLVVPAVDLDAPVVQRQEAFCNQLAFTPWHSLPEHRPLGHINRARKFVYEASRQYRFGSASEPDGSERFD